MLRERTLFWTTELFEIGSYGTGSLNITDKGYVTSSIVAILGYQAGSNGQLSLKRVASG
ncbi:hypothetical protein ACP0HM_05885 [Escherichia coli]